MGDNVKCGIDIGGTFIKVVFQDGKTEKHRTPKTLRDLLDFIETTAAKHKIDRLAIAVAGLVELSGKIREAPNLAFLRGVPLKELLKERGIEALILNDATSAALGEFKFGAGKGSKVLLCITVGTGIGGGAVIDGSPLLGANGLAMEVGHILINPFGFRCNCGRIGCLEAHSSSYAIERIYRRLTGVPMPSWEIIESSGQNKEAEKALVEAAENLGRGIVSLSHIFNPDTIVLCGGIIQTSQIYFETAKNYALKNMFESVKRGLKIAKGKLGAFSGAFGALGATELGQIWRTS